MRGIMALYQSSLGKKIIMALSGIVMVLFVIGHMGGNLKFFAGIDGTGVYAIDAYAHHLRTMGEEILGHGNFLWLVRIGLLLAVVVHVVAAIQLKAINRAGKPVDYKVSNYRSATPASRGMFWGGLLLLTFIILHILHFTTGHVHLDGFVEGQVYANVHKAFQHWYWVAFYVAAMTALGFHLYHGVWSGLQTLGIDTPSWNASLRCAAKGIAVLVFAGFISVPVGIFLGVVAPPQSQVSMVQGH